MWSMVAQRLTQITPPAATPDQLWQRVEAAFGLLYPKNTSKVSLNQCQGVWQRLLYNSSTNASKTEQITSIAGITENSSFAYRINPNNSIFTAEALAICQALDDLPVTNKNLLILSDSFSALQNYSIKSHSVIHKLSSKICILSYYNYHIFLLWTPGHSNILWNEQSDNLARTVRVQCLHRLDRLRKHQQKISRES
ncbi:RNase H domain-containing protein [Trichonephila clavipes]|nr:RNase H domain-containing protein [Trichonephila clavipes]